MAANTISFNLNPWQYDDLKFKGGKLTTDLEESTQEKISKIAKTPFISNNKGSTESSDTLHESKVVIHGKNPETKSTPVSDSVAKGPSKIASVVSLGPIEELKSTSKHLWKLVGTTENDEGGLLHTYRMHEGFDSNKFGLTDDQIVKIEKACEEIQLRIFPALEPSSQNLEIMQRMINSKPSFFELLGYKCETDSKGAWVITLPNREALLENWKILKEINKNLPDLTICGAKGIASDLDFVQAFLDNDMLLSSDVEFIHDQFYHVIPTIFYMLSDSGYESQRKVIMGDIKYYHDTIKKLHEQKDRISPEELEFLTKNLGILVDNTSTAPNYRTSFAHSKAFFTNIEEKKWQDIVVRDTKLGKSYKGRESELPRVLRETWEKANTL